MLDASEGCIDKRSLRGPAQLPYSLATKGENKLALDSEASQDGPRMTRWKSISGGLLAILALSNLAGTTLDRPAVSPTTPWQAVYAVVTFLSVWYLDQAMWRFIVPRHARSEAKVVPPFSGKHSRRFFSGIHTFGYLQVAAYCFDLSGYSPLSASSHHPLHADLMLGGGLFWIGLGMVMRLRKAFRHPEPSNRAIADLETAPFITP